MIEIVSNEGTRIQFDDREARYSNVLKSLYEDGDEYGDEYGDKYGEKKFSETIPLDYISSKQLQILKSLLENLVKFNLNLSTLKKINSYNDMYSPIKDILNIREDFTIEHLFKFIDICNFLDIPVLLHILKMKIYIFIDNETHEDIIKMFNINEDLIKDDSEIIENYVKDTDIYDVFKKYKLETGYLTKKRK